MKRYQVALLALLAVAAAFTVGCGSSSVPTFTKMPMWSSRTVTPTTQLFTMGVDGSSVTPVQTGSSNSIWGISVSADFKTAVYASGGEVWGIGPNGGTPTQLTQNAANNTFAPIARISPNGQKIVYPVFENSVESASIWIMNADGTGSTNLTPTLPTGMGVCYVASFSADSSKITFACWSTNSPTTYSLFTIRTDGTQLTTVLTQSSPIDTPAFTANGKQILYVTWGTPGAALRHLSSCAAALGWNHQHPQPMTSCIANTGVASVNLDGSNPTLIVPSASYQILESEILNSTLYYMMYSSSVNHNQIFKANLDGTGSASISDGTANDELGVCFGCRP